MDLTITDARKDLERLEIVIQKNIGSFFDTGRALIEIRDRELYKLRNGGAYETFDAYCRGVWDFARSTAYQFIDSVKVIENIRNCGQIDVIPTTESQARPLARLKPEQQREAWQKAVDTATDGKVTAKHVNKIIRDMTEPEKPLSTNPTYNQTIATKQPVSDEFNRAFDQMAAEIKSAKETKWKKTSREGAIELIKILLTLTDEDVLHS